MNRKPTYEELEQRVSELERETARRQRAEETLRESEERYRGLVESNPDAVIYHRNGRILFTNRAAVKVWGGKSTEDLLGRDFYDLVHPDYREELMARRDRVMTGEDAPMLEARFLRLDGQKMSLEVTGSLVVLASGPVVQTIARDITERKRAEMALKESEERFRILFEHAPDPYYLNSTDGAILDGNKAAEEFVGYKREELIGKNFAEMGVLSEDDLPKALSLLEMNQQGKSTGPDEFKLFRKNGEPVYAEISTHPVSFRSEQFVLGIARDISDRKKADMALRESEEQLRKLIEHTPAAVAMCDRQMRYLTYSHRWLKDYKLGEKNLIGQCHYDVFSDIPEHWKEEHQRCFAGEYIKKEDEPFPRQDGSTDWVRRELCPWQDRSGEVAGLIMFTNVITEKKRLEAQLRQVQKMEAIGTLAGGIAHDFNNILSAVVGYAELSLLNADEQTELHLYQKEILSAGERARDLVKQILTFSRQAEQERRPIQIKPICLETLKFIRASIPTTIEIRKDINSDALVMADPTQIHQIIMNLCTNAEHAMREIGGILEIGLHDVVLDTTFTADYPELSPGSYQELTVKDTGHGIPAHIMDRIYDPFFTTKKTGEGTGMGLSVIHGIVGSHAGIIKASSQPGRGSTFSVYLPVIESLLDPQIEDKEPLATGKEHILFVDDEPALVDIGIKMLESLGYRVTGRTGSIEALELFKANPDRFDLVITDMSMPNMSGDIFSGELMKIKPEIPIILCTGYSARITGKTALDLGLKAFVYKPVVLHDLAKTVRNVLDGSYTV